MDPSNCGVKNNISINSLSFDLPGKLVFSTKKSFFTSKMFPLEVQPSFFCRLVYGPPFFIVRVYHDPKGNTIFNMVAKTSRVPEVFFGEAKDPKKFHEARGLPLPPKGSGYPGCLGYIGDDILPRYVGIIS